MKFKSLSQVIICRLFLLYSLLLWNESLIFSKDSVEPILTIKSPQKIFTYYRNKLLARKDVVRIKVVSDPAYSGKTMTYTAVPLSALFKSIEVPAETTLLFKCSDGFSAPISKEKLLNESPSQSIAYLAIETEDQKWPPISSEGTTPRTPAPFYVIWTNPQSSQINREEWPFQVISFELQKSIRETYPAIVPEIHLKENNPVVRGFHIFTKTCFTCHTLNLQGESKFGPDLNIPLNPTEYFTGSALKKLIRNPQSLRNWPEGKMIGFTTKDLSDNELNHLISYLKYMRTRKIKIDKRPR